MIATSLLVVFVVAKIMVVVAHPVPFAALTIPALLWQDVAVVAFVALIERNIAAARRPLIALYVLVVLYVALTLPVARVLATPLTLPMLRAAGGALSDSIRYHATAGNIIAMSVVLVIGCAAPLLPSSRTVITKEWNVGAVAFAFAGCCCASQVDTRGFDRNVVVALARGFIPRVQPLAASVGARTEWRASPVADSERATHARNVTEMPSHEMNLLSLRGAYPRANVIIIVLESTAAQYLKPFGAVNDPAPNLTRLAARSLLFRNAYTVFPESVKGLVATLASAYPAFDVRAEDHVSMMSPSIASELDDAGYSSALFHSGRFMYLGMRELVDASGFAVREDAGDIGGNHESSFGIDESSAVARVLRWIDSVPHGRPFFAAYLPIAAHHPYAYTLPGPFDTDAEADRYRNAIHEGDAAIGALLRGLEARGLDDSTIIVVAGDHGEAFGQHSGNYGHDLALYDENVHVPLMIALPDARVAARVSRPVSLLDIAPTILDLAGIPVPAAFQGESMLRPRSNMALFFTDYSLGLVGLRDGCAKFIYELSSRRSQLFDVCVDPLERRDLARDFSYDVKRYAQHLERWTGAQVARVRSSRR